MEFGRIPQADSATVAPASPACTAFPYNRVLDFLTKQSGSALIDCGVMLVNDRDPGSRALWFLFGMEPSINLEVKACTSSIPAPPE
jgi:hypothetical protein